MKIAAKILVAIAFVSVVTGCAGLGTKEISVPEDRGYEEVLIQTIGKDGATSPDDRTEIKDQKDIKWLMKKISGYEVEDKDRDTIIEMLEATREKPGTYTIAFFPENLNQGYSVVMFEDGTIIYQDKDMQRMTMVSKEKHEELYEDITHRFDLEF
ncbi:hypothetical protein [Salimicrobium halophilum]|uniref:Lipoprotein n=1 Tax=Salimicrobium halophilum TaxID=86666 RepID=A0A1G8R778_9BACI|nr:hypothetical protein [Salimicrobium halophilum]SDJ12788.1 hypothetical protein SAMN04490247_0870 [Salimicrobium halophilum]